MYHIWKLAEIPHTRWSGPACSSSWTTHAATERANKQSRHHPKSPMSRSNAKAAGEFTCQWRDSASCSAKPPPGSQLHLLKVRKHTEILWITTQQLLQPFTARWVMPFWRPPPFQQIFPSPNMNHPGSGSCSVSSWGTESSSAWWIFNSPTAGLFSPDAPPVLTEPLMPALILWSLYSTRWGALAGQHPAEVSPKARLCLQAQSCGCRILRESWEALHSSCSNMPQGYMQSHIHSGFFACKCFMGTRMLLYCLFKTHCNSSGDFIENQH